MKTAKRLQQKAKRQQKTARNKPAHQPAAELLCINRLACSSAPSPPPSRSAASLDESSCDVIRGLSLPIVWSTANHSFPPCLPRANHLACLAMPASPCLALKHGHMAPPFAQQHLKRGPTGHPREERTWVAGGKWGRPPRGFGGVPHDFTPPRRRGAPGGIRTEQLGAEYSSVNTS